MWRKSTAIRHISALNSELICPGSSIGRATALYAGSTGSVQGCWPEYFPGHCQSRFERMEKHRSRARAQAGFIRQPCPGQHWGLRPFQPDCSRSPTAETRRRERRQCRCESCREHQFFLRAASIKVMQRSFKPQNTGQYRGSPPSSKWIVGVMDCWSLPTCQSHCTPCIQSLQPHCSTLLAGSSNSRTAPFEGARGGANPSPAAISNLKSKFRTLGGEIGSCLAYTQKSEGQNLPERPLPF